MDTKTNLVNGADTTPWIFLRGLTRESRHWGDFIGQFDAAMPGCRVITLDFPGNGRLHLDRSPTRVQDMTQRCRAQLRERRIEPPYRLLAMSLGAMVAVDWSSSYPCEIEAQVLINTSLRPFNPFYERLQPANYGALLKLAFPGVSANAQERTILRLTSNHTGTEGTEAVLPHWLALRQSNPVSRINALRQLVAAARFCAPQIRPAAATLILVSAQDRLVSKACSQALATHWQCGLRIHPSAGHDLPLDDGPWVAAEVREFCRTSPEVSPRGHEAPFARLLKAYLSDRPVAMQPLCFMHDYFRGLGPACSAVWAFFHCVQRRFRPS